MNQLYIQYGLRTAEMQATEMHFHQWLASNARTYTITESNREQIKTSVAPYAIGGDVLNGHRSNENVLNRDLVAIDLDSISDAYTSEETLFTALESFFKTAEFWLYPTISNGFKGARYRVIIPLAQPLTEHPYRILVQSINSELFRSGILSDLDSSNWTWDQVFGLPLDPSQVMHHGGESYTFTDNMAAQWQVELKNRPEVNPKKPLTATTSTSKRGYSEHNYERRIGLIDQLCYFVDGIGEGQRNKAIYTFARSIFGAYERKYGKLFPASELDGVYALVRGINSTCVNPPLDDQETLTAVKSAYQGYITNRIGGMNE